MPAASCPQAPTVRQREGEQALTASLISDARQATGSQGAGPVVLSDALSSTTVLNAVANGEANNMYTLAEGKLVSLLNMLCSLRGVQHTHSRAEVTGTNFQFATWETFTKLHNKMKKIN